MATEGDFLIVQQIVDVLFAAYLTGDKIDDAREKDGRIPHSTWHSWKRTRPELFQLAQERLGVLISEERTEQVQGAYKELAQKLLDEMLPSVMALREIRDGASSDFTRLQAASALLAWGARLNDSAKPVPLPQADSKQQALPSPDGRRSLISLLDRSTAVREATTEIKMTDGSRLTETLKVPDIVDQAG